MSEHARKRAVVLVPLSLVAEALRLQPGVHLELARQTPEHAANGVVEFICGGDVLDPAFLTAGPAVAGLLEWTETDDRLVGYVIPQTAKKQT